MKQQNTDPTKRITIIEKGCVRFRYPEHFTNQQRGYTPAVGVSASFPGYIATKPAEPEEIRYGSQVQRNTASQIIN